MSHPVRLSPPTELSCVTPVVATNFPTRQCLLDRWRDAGAELGGARATRRARAAGRHRRGTRNLAQDGIEAMGWIAGATRDARYAGEQRDRVRMQWSREHSGDRAPLDDAAR